MTDIHCLLVKSKNFSFTKTNYEKNREIKTGQYILAVIHFDFTKTKMTKK